MGKREKDINKQSIQFQSQNNIQSKSNPPGSMSHINCIIKSNWKQVTNKHLIYKANNTKSNFNHKADNKLSWKLSVIL